MDIYKYINSKDIADHCRSIGHQFNAAEAAFIVNNAHGIPIIERHALYMEIIKTLSDISGHMRYGRDYSSLHEMLMKFIRIEKTILEIFQADTDKAIYKYGYFESYMGDIEYFEDDGLYDSLSIILDDIKTENSDRDDRDKFHKCRIVKQWINSNEYINVTITPEGEPINCHSCGLLNEEDSEFHRDLFGDMWIKVPTPFKKGDIVIDSSLPVTATGLCRGAFVLENICYWNRDEYSGHDSTDMTAYGYWLNEEGLPYSECMHLYLDLEYVKEELTDDWRLLTAISNHLKEDISAALLLNAFEFIRCERHLRESRYPISCYIDEWVQKAGLKPEDKKHNRSERSDENEN